MTQRLLVVPDVHQSASFLQRIEKDDPIDRFDRVVLLGDFFDPKLAADASPASLRHVLEILESWKVVLGERMVVLLGNHDLTYYLDFHWRDYDAITMAYVYNYYGPPRREYIGAASVLRRDGIWHQAKLVHFEANYLFSHAGVHPAFWNSSATVEENVRELNDCLRQILSKKQTLNPLFCAGRARGGDKKRGGPLWLDWNVEFEDELTCAQIVGHTVDSTWRKRGRSYCIDARQSCYGVIEDGQLKIRHLFK